MPKQPHRSFALLRLTRPWNLVMIAGSMGVFFWQVIHVHWRGLEWAIVAMVCAAGAGNVINDYFDQREDRINKPRRALVGRVVKRRVALATHHALSAVAVAAAGWGAWQLKAMWPLLYVVALGGLLAAYSPFFKRRFLRGNVLIALAVGQLPIWAGGVSGLADAAAWRVLAGYALVSSGLTFIREVVKDVQDAEGDARWGYDTLAVRWGQDRTMRLLGRAMGLGWLGLVGAFVWWWGQIGGQAAWCLTFLLPYFGATRALHRGDIKGLSAWLKATLAGGMVAVAVAPPLA